MQMNRKGMLAMVDAMVFVVIIMAAAAVMVHSAHTGTSDSDAGDVLESVMSSKVRMSDLREGGDGSIVKVSDMVALDLLSGTTDALDFVEECLGSFSKGRPYLLTVSFGDHQAILGSEGSRPASSASVDLPVTTGGAIHAELVLYLS